jgi:hypothetical protein
MTAPAMEIEPSILRIPYLLHLNIFPDAMSFKKNAGFVRRHLKIRVKGAATPKLTPESPSKRLGASGLASSNNFCQN